MDAEVMNSLIWNTGNYDAHIVQSEDGKCLRRELLLEHTELTEKYFRRLWKEKQIYELVERLWSQMRKELTVEAREFLVEMIEGIPAFHDLGKINPEFQRRKLQNMRVKEDSVFACVGGRHSIISAVLYLDYFLGRLKETVKDREDK